MGMSFTFQHLLLAALGGAIGGMGRHWVSGLVARRVGATFPCGTLVVNVTGAIAIGSLSALLLHGETWSVSQPSLWAMLTIGILGSYTTVSSFSLQTLTLIRDGDLGAALLNICLSLGLCLGAAAAAFYGVSQMIGG